MADLATLGLRVDSSQGVQELRKFNIELEKTGRAGDNASRVTKAQEVELRKLAEISRNLGDTQGRQFQTLIRLNGGMERFLQIQRQIDREMAQADEVAKKYEATTTKVEKSTNAAGVSIRSLRSPLSTFAAQLSGLNPQVAQLSGLLGTFAVGSTLMVGVLAGLAVLAYAYDKLTSSQQKARKEADDLTQSLINQQKAQFDATRAGQFAILQQARANVVSARSELSGANALTGGLGGVGGIALGFFKGSDAAKRYADALTAAKIAENNLRESEKQEGFDVAEFFKARAAAIKEEADAKKKADDAALSAMDKRINILAKIKVDLDALTSNIEAKIGAGPDIGEQIRLKFVGPVDRTPPDEAKRIEEQSRFDVQWRRSQSEMLLGQAKTTKGLSNLERAAQQAGNALESIIVQKIGGGGFGGALGSSVARGALADATKPGTFADSAVGGAIFSAAASTIGSAIGAGFDAFFKDVFGGAARKKAQEALQRAIESFARSIASENARLSGNQLQADIIDVQQEFENRRQQARELFPVRKAAPDRVREQQEAIRNAHLEELNALEAKRIQQLKEEDAERKRYATEDLEVRALRAQGKDKEAERLATENRQRQELFEAQQAGMSAEYIARLKQVQALELAAEELNKFSTETRNAPRGFKVESYINRFGAALGPQLPPVSIPYNPTAPTGMPTKVVNVFQIGEKAILIDGNETDTELAKKMVRGLRKIASTTIGPNVSTSEVLDYVN